MASPATHLPVNPSSRAQAAFRKGQFVRYRAQGGFGPLIEAIIRRAHRDGSVTIEARHVLNEAEQIHGGYLGHRYRIDTSGLQVVS